MRVWFSRMEIIKLFLGPLAVIALLYPQPATSAVLNIAPEFGSENRNFKNTQSEKSPFQGTIYGLGVDLKSGRPGSNFQVMLSGFMDFGTLANKADVAAGESQTTQVLGGGIGFNIYRVKLRGGVASMNATDTFNSAKLQLGALGTFYGFGVSVVDKPSFALELGGRYTVFKYDTTTNPGLSYAITSESYMFYLSIGYQIGLKFDAQKPWGRNR